MTYTTRTTCTACGHRDLPVFLDLGMSPVADAYTVHPAADPAGRSDVYPLRVAACGGCGLAQLLDVLDGETLFGTGYSFHSSASPPLSAYHAEYAANIIYHAEGTAVRHGVVEIGCNDGDMLRHFPAAGLPAYGIDPAAGPVAVARSRGLDVVSEPFSLELAQKLRAERGPAGLVVANHVLAHVEDVADVLAGVRHLLRDDGRAVIEVQYLPDLLLNNAFDLVYHEHRNFFSLRTLEWAAARQGLRLSDWLTTDRQGGSLRAQFRPDEPDPSAPRPIRGERWLVDGSAYAGMQGRAERVRDRLQEVLSDLQGRTVAGYGAPAKLTTLAAFCGLDVSDVAWVQDTTTAKQGRYVPGTSIPIVAPKSDDDWRPDVYLLAAWNYAGPIMRRETRFAAGGGRWLVPFPAPVLL